MATAAIDSPCIKVCSIEPKSGLCLGCGRNMNEIGRWAALSDAERRTIMAALPARLTRLRAVSES